MPETPARRPYTVTDKVRARGAKGAAAVNGPDTAITRIERARANLTPTQWDRLRSLLASAPTES